MRCRNCSQSHKHLQLEYLGDVIDQYDVHCSYCGYRFYLSAAQLELNIDDREIVDLSLSEKTTIELQTAGVTVQWLLEAELSDFYQFRSIGMLSIKEIEKALDIQYL